MFRIPVVNAKTQAVKNVPVGDIVKVLRGSAELSQQQLADQAGVHVQTIKTIELNQVEPTISVFSSIMQVLGYKFLVTKIEDVVE